MLPSNEQDPAKSQKCHPNCNGASFSHLGGEPRESGFESAAEASGYSVDCQKMKFAVRWAIAKSLYIGIRRQTLIPDIHFR